MKYLSLVWSNLLRKKMRTILTILSITVAFLLFGYLSAITAGLTMGVNLAGLDRLAVRHKVSMIQFLPESYKDRMERIPGVDAAVHATWFGGSYQGLSNRFPQFPVEPESYLNMYPEYVLAEEEKLAWLNTRTGAIAGRGVADRYGWKVGDRIPIGATIWIKKDGSETWEFDLVGIYEGAEEGTDTNQFLFRYDYFEESRGLASGQVGWYAVRIDDPDRATEIAATIEAEFANSPAEVKAEPEGAMAQGFANQIGNVGLIMTSIIAAVFFTILLVAANTMAYAVRERTNELAVLKAIGFTDQGVLGLVLAESFLITTIGGLIGLALAWFLVSAGDPTGGSLQRFFIPINRMAWGLVLIAAMALIAGLLPALQAQRLQISDALRR